MHHRPQPSFGSDQLALPLFPVAMRRVDPARNMARFYSLDVERDLFGRVVLVRRWGRIATAGKVRLDEYSAETAALAALRALQALKVRKGYRSTRRWKFLGRRSPALQGDRHLRGRFLSTP